MNKKILSTLLTIALLTTSMLGAFANTSDLSSVPFGEETNGKDVIFLNEDGKPLNPKKGMVQTMHLGNDGKQEVYWNLDGDAMRIYLKNEASQSVDVRITKLPDSKYGGMSLYPFTLSGNSSVTKTYTDIVPGRYRLYVINEDGSNLDLYLRVRDITY